MAVQRSSSQFPVIKLSAVLVAAICLAAFAPMRFAQAQIAGSGDLNDNGVLDTDDVNQLSALVSGETPVIAADLSYADLAPLGAPDQQVQANDLAVLTRALTEPDLDGDGLNNDYELSIGSSPFSKDSDADGLEDPDEQIAGTSLTNPDSDGDSLLDGAEFEAGTDPLSADSDDDTVADDVDNCALVANANQADDDADGVGNACDNCDLAYNPGQEDADGDQAGDICDNCITESNVAQLDTDLDGFGNACDSDCVDPADPDPDFDGVCGWNLAGEVRDNCPNWPNPTQEDGGGVGTGSSGDGIGDACQCGDVTDDGRVDAADRDAYIAYMSTGDPYQTILASEKCDIDGDGICTAADASFVTNLVDSGTPLPVPGMCADYAQVIDHTLSRVAFGGDAQTRHVIRELAVGEASIHAGVDAYIQQQLVPESIDDSSLDVRFDPYTELDPDTEIGTEWPTLDRANPSGIKNMNFLEESLGTGTKRPSQDLAEMKLLRAVFSNRQLEAVMLDLMFDHLNVNYAGGFYKWPQYAILHYEAALKEHLFGKFEDMLQVSSESAAMLDYLDQQRSQVGAINENYGREIMELHSVGDGTYEQYSVIEASRLLTGYSLEQPAWNAAEPNTDWSFNYDFTKHDPAGKVITVTGTQPWVFVGANGSPACGEDNDTQPEAFVCLLSMHPATARRIAELMVTRFISEDLTGVAVSALIDDAASEYTTSGGDLGDTLAVILGDPLFKESTYFRSKVKRPFASMASMFRALGPDSIGSDSIGAGTAPFGGGSETRASGGKDGGGSSFKSDGNFHGAFNALHQMSEVPYNAVPPVGYADDSSSHASSGGLLARDLRARKVMNKYANAHFPNEDIDLLVHFGIPEGSTDTVIVDLLSAQILPGGLRRASVPGAGQSTRDLIIATVGETSVAYHKVAHAITMLLSSPEFLLH
jgi:hypothetical protein